MDILDGKLEFLKSHYNSHEVKINTYKEIREIVNQEPIKTIHALINNPGSNYLKIFIGSNLNNETLKFFNSKNIGNISMKSPNLFIHSILLGAIINEHPEEDHLENISKFILNFIKYREKSEVAEALSHSIGFTIGDSLYKGKNANSLFSLFSSDITKKKKKFMLGLEEGFSNKYKGFHSTSEFKSIIASDYQEWEVNSKRICMELLDCGTVEKKDDYSTIYKPNARIAWALNSLYPNEITEKIFQLHENAVSFMEINDSKKSKKTKNVTTPLIKDDKPKEEYTPSPDNKGNTIKNVLIKKYL